jgi:hypothetical protein
MMNYIPYEQRQVELLEEIALDINNLNPNINVDVKPINNISVDINKIERTTNIYVRNEIVKSSSLVNYISTPNITIHYPPISNSKKQKGISILGIDKTFYIKDCRLVDNKDNDLTDYLPLIFNYEPPNLNIILVGIVGYTITKNNQPQLTYETFDKKTGVRKIFNAGTGLWFRWNKKIIL